MNVERWLNDSSNYWSDDDFYARAQKSSQKGFTIYHTPTQLIIIQTTNLSDFKPSTKNKPEKVNAIFLATLSNKQEVHGRVHDRRRKVHTELLKVDVTAVIIRP
jgi:hypothetical protein